MTIIFHFESNQNIIAGMTLKNHALPENNNMALHVSNQPEKVINNRRELAKVLEFSLDDFVCAEQTHSDHFYKVTSKDKGRGTKTMNDAIRDTDALYTKERGIVLSTFTADCVPLSFYDEKKEIVGIIHSGWQGTIKEITPKLLNHLLTHEHCNPKDIHVNLGACISQKAFEVDEDVMLKFKALNYTEPFIFYRQEIDKYHIDNQAIVKTQCLSLGIPEENILSNTKCTYQNQDHFSYRLNKQTGRHLSFIVQN